MDKIVSQIQKNVREYKFRDNKIYLIKEYEIKNKLQNYLHVMNDAQTIKNIIKIISLDYIEKIKTRISEVNSRSDTLYYVGNVNASNKILEARQITQYKTKIGRKLTPIEPNKSMVKQPEWADIKLCYYQ